MVENGEFRSDLYFRINVIPIELPSLRERREDIKPLAQHFIRKHARLNRREIQGISAEGMDLLMRYDFPGNVRELENIIERAVILARSDTLTREDLPLQRETGTALPSGGSLPQQVEALERRLLRAAMQAAGSVQTAAAEKLGISERTLRYKLQKYGLQS